MGVRVERVVLVAATLLEVRMRRILIVLAGCAVVSIAAESRVSGQSSTASLTVSASVSKNCTITTAPVAFGAYDPVAANSTAPLDGIGTITLTCTKGAVATVTLGAGGNPAGGTRQMNNGAGAFLKYALYQDTGRATVWGEGANAQGFPAAPSKEPRNFTVYGRVDQAQDVTVGSYTDTVLATVNF